jgi:hypothetical protein
MPGTAALPRLSAEQPRSIAIEHIQKKTRDREQQRWSSEMHAFMMAVSSTPVNE